MAENKTRLTGLSVNAFIEGVPEEHKRRDSFTILELMKRITGKEPLMWGDSIIGFGSYHYKYESGREGDMPLAGFSPRKQNLTIYILSGFDNYDRLMGSLGKHKTGKICLYINRLSDVDLTVLEQIIRESYNLMLKREPG
ncbi:MAG: hypothetical protein A2Z16_02970 [Chloroflexi bacterium RBG_16_54_18]|nr:MAG: hypothetical protein A2Z16_02970 [Chloroflexi bacterium RBG_16_54_18]